MVMMGTEVVAMFVSDCGESSEAGVGVSGSGSGHGDHGGGSGGSGGGAEVGGSISIAMEVQ